MLRIAVAVVLFLQCCSVTMILAARPFPSDPGEGNQDWRDPVPGYPGVGQIGHQP
jgi:hypothetical protein